MKKSIVMILTVFALVFLLSACLDLENPSETTVTSGFEPTVTEGEPTVTDEIKPTVAEDEPTATEAIEPTATEAIEPTATEAIEPTATEAIEPTVASEATHVHAWEDVLGEHARICTDCQEKQLKPEACNFVRTNCKLPRECTICHATDGAPPEEHEMKIIDRKQSCWYIDITEACSKCGMEVGMCGTLALPAHLWEEKTADGKTTLACSRCHESDTFASEAEAFSYAEDLETYKIGDPGVEHENFAISHDFEITSAADAVIMAKCQLTIEYDTVSVSFDRDSDVWRVDFYTLGMLGGSQSVYLRGDGSTCYVVYGE